jgi:hypothetical protein
MLPGLRGWAERAYRDGEVLRTRVGTRRDVVAKEIRLEVMPPARGATQTLIPIRWEATGAPALFPKLEADLVVSSVGPEFTQVALRGSYQVPLGRTGRALDRVVLHHLAEASVKAFLDQIARAVNDGFAQAAPARAAAGGAS